MKQVSEQRMWIKNAGAQSISSLCAIILIGITGNYVGRHYSYLISYSDEPRKYLLSRYLLRKYHFHQAQLASAILMVFSTTLFIGLFLYLYLIVRTFSNQLSNQLT